MTIFMRMTVKAANQAGVFSNRHLLPCICFPQGSRRELVDLMPKCSHPHLI